jgi:protein phosphatase PTC7
MAIAAKAALSEDVNPKALLNVGYKRVLDEDVIKGGASTACVAVLTQKGQMAVAK